MIPSGTPEENGNGEGAEDLKFYVGKDACYRGGAKVRILSSQDDGSGPVHHGAICWRAQGLRPPVPPILPVKPTSRELSPLSKERICSGLALRICKQ